MEMNETKLQWSTLAVYIKFIIIPYIKDYGCVICLLIY